MTPFVKRRRHCFRWIGLIAMTPVFLFISVFLQDLLFSSYLSVNTATQRQTRATTHLQRNKDGGPDVDNLTPPPKHAPVSIVTDSEGRMTSLLKPEETLVVPNIVHYVWFGQYESLKFHQFLAIKSAFLNIKPAKVMFHCDYQPIGPWWKELLKIVQNNNKRNGTFYKWIFEKVHLDPPTKIFGNTVMRPEHQSNIAQMDIIYNIGGIYLDLDVIALKSFEPLRYYNYTMGIEYHGNPGRLNNGIIISRPGAEFINIWRETYHTFKKTEWDEHDSQIPYKLQFQVPKLIHVEETSLNYPSGKDIDLIYEELYDWSGNYAIHLWFRLHELQHGPAAIKTMNTTFGEITRYIYYGSPRLLN